MAPSSAMDARCRLRSKRREGAGEKAGCVRVRVHEPASVSVRVRVLARFFLCLCRTHQQTASSGSIRNSSNRRAKIRVKTPAHSPLVVPVSSTGVNTKRSFRICPVLRQKIQKLAIWPKPLPLPAAAAAVLPEVGRTDAEAAPHCKTHAGIPAGACAARVPPRAGTGANSGRPIPATAAAAAAQKGTTCTGGRGSHSQSAGKKNLSNSQPRSGHDTYFFSSIWMAWYHPMPRLGAPQPTRTTSA